MNLKENLIICSDCNTFTFSCQCICPYCGDMVGSGCDCSNKTLENKDTEIEPTNPHLDSMTELTRMQELIKEYDDDWWRLEKWKVGRSIFHSVSERN